MFFTSVFHAGVSRMFESIGVQLNQLPIRPKQIFHVVTHQVQRVKLLIALAKHPFGLIGGVAFRGDTSGLPDYVPELGGPHQLAVLGTGGGGYFLFCAAPFQRFDVVAALTGMGLDVDNVVFDHNGLQSWTVRQ